MKIEVFCCVYLLKRAITRHFLYLFWFSRTTSVCFLYIETLQELSTPPTPVAKPLRANSAASKVCQKIFLDPLMRISHPPTTSMTNTPTPRKILWMFENFVGSAPPPLNYQPVLAKQPPPNNPPMRKENASAHFTRIYANSPYYPILEMWNEIK